MFECSAPFGAVPDPDRSDSPRDVSIRCPKCRQIGVFFGHTSTTDLYVELDEQFEHAKSVAVGSRFCPKAGCRAHVFIVRLGDKALATYPAERLDFDPSDVPAQIVKAFEESLTCEANGCFVAAAMLVRKTLEGLCRDRNAQGRNLKEKVQDLGTKIIIPRDLLEGLDEIRLLGNDAAHVEAQTYDQIGKEELAIAVEFTKEVLKATYQLASLVNRMRALKK